MKIKRGWEQSTLAQAIEKGYGRWYDRYRSLSGGEKREVCFYDKTGFIERQSNNWLQVQINGIDISNWRLRDGKEFDKKTTPPKTGKVLSIKNIEQYYDKIKDADIRVRYCFANNQTIEIKISNREELVKALTAEINVWVKSGTVADMRMTRIKFPNLKEGVEVFIAGKGKGTIVQVYDSLGRDDPQRGDVMVECDGETIQAALNTVYELPYYEYEDEFEKFNECKDEGLLSPYTERRDGWLCVWWNKVPQAANYVVSIYKCFANEPYKQVYHLKDFVVDRNDGYLSVAGMIGPQYIVTVKAENREGNIIALSRGIKDSGQPCFWGSKTK